MDRGGMDHGSKNRADCHGGGCHGGGQGGMCMMSMFFHFGFNEIILFDWWKTTSATELIVAVFAVGLMAILCEGIKFLRESFLQSSLERQSSPTIPGSTTALHGSPTEPGCVRTMFSRTHLIQSLLHAVQFTISYMIMLVFMTYNVYLCVGVGVGATIGYFLFGWRSSSLSSVTADHCH